MLNVLILIHNLRPTNGVASFVMNYFRRLNPNEVHMDFALYADRPSPYYDEIERVGSTIYILPKVKNLNKHIKKCNEILAARDYDVIHDNTLHISIPMMWRAKRKGIPVRILHSHNTKLGETYQKEIRNKLILPLLRGLATDDFACSELAGKTMFGKKQFNVVPNAINPEKYIYLDNIRNRVRKEEKAGSKVIIGTVGRLSVQKNPYFAVDVFSELLKVVPNAEYWWVGSGELDREVAQYAESKGLSHSIRFFGNRTDVLELYQAMDCFFLPSLFEGLPLTGVEAQAMGLPMVVSDAVTQEMVYTDLVEYVPLDAPMKTWIEAIEKQMNRIPERRSYTKELENSVFSIKNAGHRLESLYEEKLKQAHK